MHDTTITIWGCYRHEGIEPQPIDTQAMPLPFAQEAIADGLVLTMSGRGRRPSTRSR